MNVAIAANEIQRKNSRFEKILTTRINIYTNILYGNFDLDTIIMNKIKFIYYFLKKLDFCANSVYFRQVT